MRERGPPRSSIRSSRSPVNRLLGARGKRVVRSRIASLLSMAQGARITVRDLWPTVSKIAESSASVPTASPSSIALQEDLDG